MTENIEISIEKEKEKYIININNFIPSEISKLKEINNIQIKPEYFILDNFLDTEINGKITFLNVMSSMKNMIDQILNKLNKDQFNKLFNIDKLGAIECLSINTYISIQTLLEYKLVKIYGKPEQKKILYTIFANRLFHFRIKQMETPKNKNLLYILQKIISIEKKLNDKQFFNTILTSDTKKIINNNIYTDLDFLDFNEIYNDITNFSKNELNKIFCKDTSNNVYYNDKTDGQKDFNEYIDLYVLVENVKNNNNYQIKSDDDCMEKINSLTSKVDSYEKGCTELLIIYILNFSQLLYKIEYNKEYKEVNYASKFLNMFNILKPYIKLEQIVLIKDQLIKDTFIEFPKYNFTKFLKYNNNYIYAIVYVGKEIYNAIIYKNNIIDTEVKNIKNFDDIVTHLKTKIKVSDEEEIKQNLYVYFMGIIEK